MRLVNLAELKLNEDAEAPEGFRKASARIGQLLGARQTGASSYELAPGQSGAPYHYEYGEEEWLLVLEGTPWLRTPSGKDQLAPLDLVFFPCGPTGAHQVGNSTEHPVRLLMWSTIAYPTVSAYPDTDRVAVWDRDRSMELMVERSATSDYYAGERASGR